MLENGSNNPGDVILKEEWEQGRENGLLNAFETKTWKTGDWGGEEMQ